MLYLFDQDDNFINILSKETGLVDTWFKDYENHIPDESFVFNVVSNSPLLEHIAEENQVAFYDRDNDLRLMRMKELYEVSTKDGHNIKVKCEPSFLELYDHFIEDRRITNGTAQTALDRALDGSRYIGEVTVDLGNASDNFYWIDGIESVFKIINTWGGSLKDTITLDEANEIIERKLWIVQRLGTDNGLLVEPDYNAETISRNTLSYPETALWAQGASLETDNGGYTRYITFADVEWKKTNGDPVDKPKGQKWVGDPDALEMYGYLHGGKRQHRFGHFSNQDYDDSEKLLMATWQELQERKLKEIIHEATIYESDKKVSLGDTVTVLNREYNKPIELQSQITGLEYDVLEPYDEIKIVVGKYIDMNEDPLQQDVDDLKDQVNKPRPTKPIDKDSYPDRKPSTPVNVEAIGGYEVIQLRWDYTDEVFVSHYEVYGSQVSDFVPDSQHLLWRGNVSAFAHSVETDQTWYYYVRAVNYHDTASEYSDKAKASSVRIIDDDLLFGEEMAERLRELNRVSDIIGEGGIDLDNLHDDIPDYFKQQAKEYTDEEIKETRDDFLKDISDVYEEIDIVDGKLVDKANKDDVYTIKNIDDMFDNVVSITEYQTDVDGFIERFENAESRLYQNETAIGSMVKQDEFEDYGDKIDRRMSEWEQTADGFVSSVERVRADLDGLEIGGRNFAFKSDEIVKNESRFSYRLSDKISGHPVEKFTVSFDLSYTGEDDIARVEIYFYNGVFLSYSGGNSSGDREYTSVGELKNDGDWYRYEGSIYTVDDIADHDDIDVVVRLRLVGGGFSDNAEVMYMQVEKGNRATDWTPAPEDMDERMTKAESSIVQNAENIDLKVNVDEIVSEINLKKEGIRIAGDLIHLDGLALIDDAVIKSAHIANTTIEKGHLKEAIIDDAHIDELTGKSIVAKTITTDHLDVAKLSSIAADLGVVTAGILESKNNNMRLNLNTGNLTMRNADFTLGGGANIEFTDRNNRILYKSNSVYAGLQFDRSLNDATNPMVAIGVSDQKHSVNDSTFRGIRIHSAGTEGRTGQGTNIVTEEFTLNNIADLSQSGFKFRMHAKDGRRGIMPMYAGNRNYDLGESSNYWQRAYINEVRVNEGEIFVRNTHASNQGFGFMTSYQGESQMAFYGMNAHNEYYNLGKSNRTFAYGYINTIIGNRIGTSSNPHRYVYADSVVEGSDVRIKENVRENNLGLDFINDIRTVNFKIKDADTYKNGVVAQELLQTLNDHGVNENYQNMVDIGEVMGVSYTQLVTPTIKAVQELSGHTKDNAVEIQMLKARIEELEKI